MSHPLRYPATRYRLIRHLISPASRAGAPLDPGAESLLQHHGALEGPGRGRAGTARRRHNGPFYEMNENPRARSRPTGSRASRIWSASSRRCGILHSDALADEWVHPPSQSDVRGRHAARLHDPRRPAGHADRAPAARCAPRRLMALPPVTLVRRFDTHRLIPSRHLPDGDSVLVAHRGR